MLARDIMTTPVRTVSGTAHLADALRLMVRHQLSGLPVVDEAGRPIGVLTEGDVLRRGEIGTDARHVSPLWRLLRGPGPDAGAYVRGHTRQVADLMTPEPVTVVPGASLEEVVGLMERRRIKRVPVVEGERIVGLVSRADILAAVSRLLDAAQETPADDAEIRARLQAELATQSWFSGRMITFEVKEGVVTLHGVVDDVRMRDALVVAAQNASGRDEVECDLILLEPSGTMGIPLT